MNRADPSIEAQPRHRPSLLKNRNVQLALALGMAAGLSLMLYLATPWLNLLWQSSLHSLLGLLGFSSIDVEQFSLWQTIPAPSLQGELPAPGYPAWLGNLGGSLLLYLLAGLLRPWLRASTRALAVFHALCVLLQAIPGSGHYSLSEHTSALSSFSLGLLLGLPAVMAATHFIVERSIERRLLATGLIAAFLIFGLPLKLAAHLVLLHTLSPLAMPSLFLVFGPTIDILCVSALYAWAVTWRNRTN